MLSKIYLLSFTVDNLPNYLTHRNFLAASSTIIFFFGDHFQLFVFKALECSFSADQLVLSVDALEF